MLQGGYDGLLLEQRFSLLGDERQQAFPRYPGKIAQRLHATLNVPPPPVLLPVLQTRHPKPELLLSQIETVY